MARLAPVLPLVVTALVAGCDLDPLADGLPDVVGCSACHGRDGNPAPPADVDGRTETSAIGVGAHEAHLSRGELAAAVACGECHLVPADPLDPAHADGLPAEVVFGALYER